MSILTKEVIQKILNDDWLLMDDCEGLENCTVIKELARMALASMDSEPVGSISIDRLLQLLYQFDGANECAASIGDQEYALECGDVASALRELLSCRSALPVADVVAWSSPNEERKCDIRWRRHDVEPGPLYRHAQQPVVNYVPLGDSPYDVPYSMPSNLREFIDQEIGILFSDDDAQGVWIACRRAAMLAAASQEVKP